MYTICEYNAIVPNIIIRCRSHARLGLWQAFFGLHSNYVHKTEMTGMNILIINNIVIFIT